MESNTRKKVLILSSSFGEGHQQVANAICEAIRLYLPNMEPIVLDFMAWAHPTLYPIGHYLYMKGIKMFPHVYDYVYQKTRPIRPSSIRLNMIHSLEAGRMLKLLKEIQPSVVVSTFPYPAAVMSKLKEQMVTTVPALTIITDHTDHSYWIHPHTDHYIVGSELVREALVQQGVDLTKITNTGIPIRQQFSQQHLPADLAVKYGLDPRIFTILVIGGGYGMIGDRESLFDIFDSLPQPLQILVVCGHNKKLYQQIREESVHFRHHVLIEGFTEYIHELMAVSNLIITKPGGVTTSEALAMELPMLLYNPLPGQEQDNARFLVQEGVALLGGDCSELSTHLSMILHNPHILKRMKQKAQILKTKESAYDALQIIVQTMYSESGPPSMSTMTGGQPHCIDDLQQIH